MRTAFQQRCFRVADFSENPVVLLVVVLVVVVVMRVFMLEMVLLLVEVMVDFQELRLKRSFVTQSRGSRSYEMYIKHAGISL